MNANGSGKRLLTTDGAVPAWSPDGNMLAFVRTSGRTDAIWLMDADGDNQRRLTDPPQLGTDYARDSMPEWSPDGETLAFVRHYRGRTDIWVTGPDGATTWRLTKDAGAHTWPGGGFDGRRIAYVHALAKRQGSS